VVGCREFAVTKESREIWKWYAELGDCCSETAPSTIIIRRLAVPRCLLEEWRLDEASLSNQRLRTSEILSISSRRRLCCSSNKPNDFVIAYKPSTNFSSLLISPSNFSASWIAHRVTFHALVSF
jgi:hypothetical protein